MKVLFVIHSLIVGGAETIVTNYVIALKKMGINVALLELTHEDTFLSERVKKSNIEYYTLPSQSSIFARILRRIYPQITVRRFNNTVKDISPDVIHFHTIFHNMDEIDFPFSRCVLTFHSRLKRSKTSSRYDFVLPLIGRLAQKGMTFISISSDVDNDVHGLFPYAKSVIIPNGMDLNEIRSKRYNKRVLCKELNIPENSFLIGQVARFHEVKNHLFTLNLFGRIAKQYGNAYLIFIGTGTPEELELINHKISELGINDKVVLMGLRNDATAIMSCFDVVLLPSKSEAFPLVMIEAQALKIRSVASNNIPAEIECNPNCFRLSLDAPIEQWIETIMGSNEHETDYSIGSYDIVNVMAKHIDLYSDLYNSKN